MYKIRRCSTGNEGGLQRADNRRGEGRSRFLKDLGAKLTRQDSQQQGFYGKSFHVTLEWATPERQVL